jgi:HEAT repeat protein/small nuclear ribonucleoprotein (snRNP)-like protein
VFVIGIVIPAGAFAGKRFRREMMFYRSAYGILIAVMVVFSYVFAAGPSTSLRVKNGTVYEGELVSENENFFVLRIGSTNVSILKRMVTEKDGVRYSLPSDTPQDQTVLVKNEEHAPGEVIIKLKNGNVFKGTIISETDKLIAFNSKGARVNIFKNVIAEIDSGKSPVAKVAEKKAAPPWPPATNNLSDAQEKKNTPVNDNKPVDNTPPVVPEKKVFPAKETRPEEKKDAAVSVPVPKKRTDGKVEIVLKDGISFVGIIESENQRYISLNSEGTVINLIKRLIKEIDGVPYKRNTGQQEMETGFQVQRTVISETDGISDNSAGDKVVKRVVPFTAIPPDVSVSSLMVSLKSADWRERSRAARLIGGMGQWAASAIPLLTDLLSDTVNSEIPAPVWIDSSEINNLLRPGLEAARTLASIGKEGFTQLSNAVSQPNPLIRKHAAFGLCELTDDNALRLLSGLLRDINAHVRAVAVGGFRSSEALEHLRTALRDGDPDVRANAAFMLGKLGDRRALQDLLTVFDDKRAKVRARAAEAVGKIGGAQAVIPLIKMLSDENPEVRKNAVISLGMVKDTAAVWPLIGALRDKDVSVRAATVKTLILYRDPQSVPSLYGMVKDRDPEVKALAEEAIKLHTEIPLLISTLDDSSPMVRENAAYLLLILTGQDIGQDKAQWQRWYDEDRKKEEKERKMKG